MSKFFPFKEGFLSAGDKTILVVVSYEYKFIFLKIYFTFKCNLDIPRNILAIRNQIPTISMHIPYLVKTHRYLLKLSSGNENTDG